MGTAVCGTPTPIPHKRGPPFSHMPILGAVLTHAEYLSSSLLHLSYELLLCICAVFHMTLSVPKSGFCACSWIAGLHHSPLPLLCVKGSLPWDIFPVPCSHSQFCSPLGPVFSAWHLSHPLTVILDGTQWNVGHID